MSLFNASRIGPRARAALMASVLLATAAAWRLAASRGPLWLDEIWSLNWAVGIHSPLQILTTIRHDNNHFLNTFCLFLFGAGWPWFAYRVPAVIAGTCSVALAGVIGAQRGRLEQMIAMVLTAFAYLLVHYSSEARGYAPLICFSLASYCCLSKVLDTGRRRWGVLCGLCASLGFLSHPAFAQVFLAMLFWSVARFFEHRDFPPPRLQSWALCHGPPLCVAALLYAVNLRHMTLGGGPEYSLPSVLLEAASLTVGGPQGGPLAVVAASLLVAGVLRGFQEIGAGDRGEWRFYAAATAVPVLQVLAARPPFLFARYFLVVAVFSLLLVSFALAAWIRRGGIRRVAALAGIALFVLANTAHSVNLIRTGRGQYLDALQFMVNAVDSGPVRFASDHPHGNRILIDFYARYLHPPRPLIYDRAVDWAHQPPHWLILHRYHSWQDAPVPASYRVENATYELRRMYDCAMLSGWRWHCYQLRPGSRRAARASREKIPHHSSATR